MRLKRDDLNAQFALYATMKWLQNEIFVTMAGAASKKIASSPKEANEISEKTIALSIVSILANYMATTLCLGAHESHVVVVLTPVCRSTFMYILQGDLLVVSEHFRAATCELALCC